MLAMTRFKYFFGYLRRGELECFAISNLSSSDPLILAGLDIPGLLDSTIFPVLKRLVSAQLESGCDFFGHVGVGFFYPSLGLSPRIEFDSRFWSRDFASMPHPSRTIYPNAG
jgi:hypothetical protein